MMLRLLAARHGETDWNTAGRFQGRTDVPLNDRGRAQAHALALRLRGEDIGAIYASHLRRAWDSALAIGAAINVEPRPDHRLAELSYGDWEGRTRAEIAERWPEIWHARGNSAAVVPPNGEPLEEAAERLGAFLDDLYRWHPTGTVLVVSHGGAMSVLACLVLGLPPSRRSIFGSANTGLAEFELSQGRRKLRRWNDTAHLVLPAGDPPG
ncbi:MAG: hypothetical protein Kow00124_29750 [Anaerolineae bacterium]